MLNLMSMLSGATLEMKVLRSPITVNLGMYQVRSWLPIAQMAHGAQTQEA